MPDSTLAQQSEASGLSAAEICRGVCRALAQLGHATLTEFPLASGRRADVIALGRAGELSIIEVKSSIADFRSDRKWPEYGDWCDRLYFAVGPDFPRQLIPEECGLFVADAFAATLLRESPQRPLNAARRRAVTLRFALAGAGRLRRMLDPAAADPSLW
jgi:hypothetical protein